MLDTGASPSHNVRSDLMVRKIGWSGRGCRSMLEDGRSTATSTVASGAAIMKIMSRTRTTSINGVTLISWTTSAVSSPWSRRTAIALLRHWHRGRTPPRIEGVDAAGGRLAEIAAHQGEDLDAGVRIERPVVGDRAGKHVVDHHRRNRGRKSERRGEQRLRDAGRHHGKVGRVQLRDADEAVH